MKKERFRRSPFMERRTGLKPYFLDFHLLTMSEDYEYPRHQHQTYEVILVDRGPYACELNGEEVQLKSGEALVVKPGDWHQDHLRTGQKHYVIHFSLDGAGGTEGPRLFEKEAAVESQICRANLADGRVLLQELANESLHGGVHSGAVQDALLEALFWRLLRALPSTGLSSVLARAAERESQKERLQALLRRHARQGASVGRLAREFRVSVRQFNNLVQEHLGGSPTEILAELRIEVAKSLLQSNGQSVKVVSEQLGFANPYHFSRVFKRVTGISPSRF